MTKRKISQQQQRRIAKNQAQKLDSAKQTGLVIANFGQQLEIEAEGKIILCSKRQNLGPIVPGDEIVWQSDRDDQNAVVVAIKQRKSLLSRPDARGKLHAVAANIDRMFIVFAPEPKPSQTTIDRYLIAARIEGIEPVIILNKEDLLADTSYSDLLKLLAVYQQIGIKTIQISAKNLEHLSLLHEQMQNNVSVFVGQSGVGKSSIIATILPNIEIKIGAISETIGQGKHTTTTARLYHVAPLNAAIIDSPGIREFTLWNLTPEDLANQFVEFEPFLQTCKFSNCKHLQEPGCSLLQAANEQKISKQRLNSYQQILNSMTQQSK